MRRLCLLVVLASAASGCSCGDSSSAARSDGAPELDAPVLDAGTWDAAPLDGGPTDVDALARQSARLALVAAKLIENNGTCGFASAAVRTSAEFSGSIGGPATMTETIPGGTPCTLIFAAPTDVAVDCVGAITTVSGSMSISGTLEVAGRRTGEIGDPMWIDRTDGVEMDLTIAFSDFALGAAPDVAVTSGTLEVRVRPERVRAAPTTICSFETPIATVEELSWHDATLRLSTAEGEATHAVSASAVDATRGAAAGGTNGLSGSMTVDGYSRAVDADHLGLDPAYSQVDFDAGWQCSAQIALPISQDCWPPPAVVADLARGVVRDVVFAAGTLDSDTTCGFSSDDVAAAAEYSPPYQTGIAGSETRTASGCSVAVPVDTSLPDCVSSQTVGGTFTAGGTRVIDGRYTGSASEPTVPVTRIGVTYSLASLALTDVEAQVPGGGAAWFRASGTVAAELGPIGGERASQAGVYSIRTPVIRIPSVTAASLTGAIRTPSGTRVDFALSDVSLAAAIGLHQGTGNSLSGTLTVDGETVTLSSLAFDPAYTQVEFDARYGCTPDLESTVPP